MDIGAIIGLPSTAGIISQCFNQFPELVIELELSLIHEEGTMRLDWKRAPVNYSSRRKVTTRTLTLSCSAS
jgi:hypothetical protein